MRYRVGTSAGLAAIAIALVIAPAAVGQSSQRLEMYTLKGRPDKIAKAAAGVELAGKRQTRTGIKADAVLTAGQRAKLEAAGVQVNEMWESGVCHGAGFRDPDGNAILLHHSYAPYGPSLLADESRHREQQCGRDRGGKRHGLGREA